MQECASVIFIGRSLGAICPVRLFVDSKFFAFVMEGASEVPQRAENIRDSARPRGDLRMVGTVHLSINIQPAPSMGEGSLQVPLVLEDLADIAVIDRNARVIGP